MSDELVNTDNLRCSRETFSDNTRLMKMGTTVQCVFNVCSQIRSSFLIKRLVVGTGGIILTKYGQETKGTLKGNFNLWNRSFCFHKALASRRAGENNRCLSPSFSARPFLWNNARAVLAPGVYSKEISLIDK